MFDVWGIGMAMTDKKMRFDPADPIMQKTLPDKGGYARLTYEDFYILADRPAISISAGGSVANSLRDLGKMGLKCVFAGKIGRDDEGQFFEKSLQKCSVVSSLSVEAEEHSGICVVLIHDDGEKTVCAKARAAKKLREEDIDFGLLFTEIDQQKYEAIPVPIKDTWGVLMRKNSPLAEKEVICPEDLWDKPLIISQQKGHNNYLVRWLQRDESELHIVATYNLLFNASLLVDEGLGYALCYDKLINTHGSNLCFRPLSVQVSPQMQLIWKKYQIFPEK